MRNPFKWLLFSLGVLLIGGLIVSFLLLRAPQKSAVSERFIIPLGMSQKEALAKLESSGFIRSHKAFVLLLDLRGLHGALVPGGYDLSKSTNAWKVATIFSQGPVLRWVVIPEGLRKEEITDLVAKDLHWDDAKKQSFLSTHSGSNDLFYEGVYFPDTYLFPLQGEGNDIAERMISHFNEKFSPYARVFLIENIKWDTALKIASLVQREAAGKDDMPLIAGILWNRLLQGMKLDIDATVQYARGNTSDGWWAPLKPEDKKINSPYNTYLFKGLPTHPIANPGLEAIDAVLHPMKTDCLYYLHDNNRQIHCAKTFEGHKKNIEQFFK